MAYHSHPRGHFIPSNLICRGKNCSFSAPAHDAGRGGTELRDDEDDDNGDNDKKELGDYDGDPNDKDDHGDHGDHDDNDDNDDCSETGDTGKNQFSAHNRRWERAKVTTAPSVSVSGDDDSKDFDYDKYHHFELDLIDCQLREGLFNTMRHYCNLFIVENSK